MSNMVYADESGCGIVGKVSVKERRVSRNGGVIDVHGRNILENAYSAINPLLENSANTWVRKGGSRR